MSSKREADPGIRKVSLDLGLIGNGTSAALVTSEAAMVWACLPRFDGDPVFCSLLRGNAQPESDGAFAIEMIGAVRSEQQYLTDTPIIITRFFDANGGAVEVTDFAPRFVRDGKLHSPGVLVRCIERVSGTPSIRLRVRPMKNYGATRMPVETGSTAAGRSSGLQMIYRGEDVALRLATNAPLTAIVDETPFDLDQPISVVLGVDDDSTVFDPGDCADFMEQTASWWRAWVKGLTIPAPWRDAVVRAAITLKLNADEESGAIIAAMTTSIPEAPNSGRNWDYRYCWLRDAYFVAAALHRLGDTETTARYLDFVIGILDAAGDAPLEPMYTIRRDSAPDEHEVSHLAGYRGMGPVRVGNQAHLQIQHDVYGEVILAARPLFDGALDQRASTSLFRKLETVGNRAAEMFDQPDAGLWELRGTERVHTFSSVMCWAACDALAGIAHRLGLVAREQHWRERAEIIHEFVSLNAWNDRLGAFTAAMHGDTLDASLLMMHTLGFIAAEDPRFRSTVSAIGRDLRRGDFIYRYVEKDDFGRPENAFLVCTFWHVDALSAIGDREEAHRLFENLLSCRNRHGLLAEDIDPDTRELWGNFVQTYSMAGIIGCACELEH